MWFIPQIVPGGPIGLPGVVFPGSSCTEKIDGYGNCVEFLLYLCRCRCHDLKDAEGPSGVEDACDFSDGGDMLWMEKFGRCKTNRMILDNVR